MAPWLLLPGPIRSVSRPAGNQCWPAALAAVAMKSGMPSSSSRVLGGVPFLLPCYGCTRVWYGCCSLLGT